MYLTSQILAATLHGSDGNVFARMLKSLTLGKLRLLRTRLGMLMLGFLLVAPAASKAQNIINTVAGGGNPAGFTPADIANPTSAVADANGNIYIAAPESYYIFKLSGGNLSIFAGIGIHGFTGDGGPATQATLGGSFSLAIDGKGNLYLADQGSNRIRMIDTNGTIQTIAGSGSGCGLPTDPCGDGGQATQAQLGYPEAVTVDGSGNVYIADTGDQRIRMVAVGTGIITTVAGNGNTCNGPNYTCGDKGLAVKAQLDLPVGVVVDGAGNLYIADTRDQRIRRVNLSSGIIDTVVGNGKICNSNQACGDGGPPLKASLFNPTGVALDGSGNLYVADTGDHRIRKITGGFPNGTINTVAGSGVQGFSGDGGVPTSAEMDLPNALFVDSAGNLIIADSGNQRVREVASAQINTIAGGGTGGDGGAAASAVLANPNAVAWDNAGNYYITDAANNRIRKVSGGTISTVVGNGSAGWSGDGGAATSATLWGPLGIAIEGSNDLFIVDTQNYIIRKVNAGTGVITTLAGNGNSCIPTTLPCGDGGPATSASFTYPTSVAVDSNGNFYIADYAGNRVRKVSSGGTITTLAGTGIAGYNGDGGLAKSALLNHPYGVTVDSSGNVYIADTSNSRIRKVDTSGTITTYALNGKLNFSGDGLLATKASMFRPFEVAMDPKGNLYIGGGVYQVVRRVDVATGTIDTVAGNLQHPGQQGFAGDGGPATVATMDNVGLAVDGKANLLVADAGNNRIRQVSLVPVATVLTKKLVFPAQTVGSTSKPMNAKLKNTGADDFTITGVTLKGKQSGDFAISSNGCSGLLAPDLVCTVAVTFTPKAVGVRIALLLITDSLGTQQVVLTGTGK
jgi:sugar lactone lactonase YvrE